MAAGFYLTPWANACCEFLNRPKPLMQPAQQAFPFGLGAKNEERESKTARRMVQVKERGGGGEESKETLPPLSFFGSRFISRAAKTGLSLHRNQTETLATQAIY